MDTGGDAGVSDPRYPEVCETADDLVQEKSGLINWFARDDYERIVEQAAAALEL